MGDFIGRHENKRDSKGRVSIPASFRASLRADGDNPCVSLILRASHRHAGIEAWPVAEFAKLAAPLDALDPFGDDHEDISAALYGDAYPVESDKEGRIVLPDWLARHAGISDAVVFMGQGKYFGIWEPQAAEARRVEARARTLARGLSLPGALAPGVGA